MFMKRRLLIFRFLILALISWWVTPLWAQLSEGGLPPSFNQVALRKSIPQYAATISFNVEKLKAEDAKLEASGRPLRALEIIPVALDMENSGEWTTLSNGQRIWRLTVNAPGAIATMLYYKDFYIPAGGKLFIYNPEHTQILGAYTSRTNPKGAEFATELVAGGELILEYAEPLMDALVDIPSLGSLEVSRSTEITPSRMEVQKSKPRISISGIGYGYNHIQVWNKPGNELRADANFNRSAACMVNINCPEGADWQHHKKGVARTITQIGSGGFLCSGTMINNTAGNLDALYLSAHHCFKDGLNQGNALFNTMIFYFNWEQPGCERTAIEPTNVNTWTGAQLLVDIDISGGSDGSLLRLNNGGTIPESYNLFYNGWDRRNTPAQSGVGIHHPKGDIKKISTFSAPATTTSWTSLLDDNSTVHGASNAHWNVKFVATANGHAITEGGSSGSPLFNEEGRVVGTLTGGNSSCTQPNGDNKYGKLWYHWDQAAAKMAPYLDPDDTGASFIDGKYAAGDVVANFSASRTKIYASESVVFEDLSYKATSWKWTFAGGVPASSTSRNPGAVVYNAPGTYEAKLIINEGTADEKEKTVNIQVLLKQNMCPGSQAIGAGTSKSQFPLGAEQRVALSSAIYTAAELNMPNGGVINKISWFPEIVTTNNRTLYIYLKEVDESTATADTWSNEVAGATLVFQSSTNWVTIAGENVIPLTIPFDYSGTKNLKVLVRVQSTLTSGYTSSNCFYTTTTDAHMTWTSTTAGIPTTNGTVDSNRPNIKFYFDIPCGATAPVADFIINDAIFEEGFDQGVIPAGWVVEKPGASARQWLIAAPTAYPFTAINPSSKFSAIIQFDATKQVDSWLKSPAISITQPNTKVEFYLFYGGSYLEGGPLSFYVSDDNGVTWVEKWTTGSTNDRSLLHAWRKQIIDLSAYVGKDIRLAWRCNALNGDDFYLDDISVYVPTDKVEIYEGETVAFLDKSQGPPVSWQWILPGGNPTSSILQNPSSVYMLEGVYDVSLTAANNIGSDTKTVIGSVTVIPHLPEVAFGSTSAAYTMRSNGGQFLPLSGGTVNFKEYTARYPRSRQWTLTGATPSSSASTTVTASYPAGENVYPVKLTGTNNAGTGELEVADYIKVGGQAEIWNMAYGEVPIQYYSSSNKLVLTPGVNFFGALAERFNAPLSGGEISSVKVFTRVTAGNPTMVVEIYSDNNGVPGNRISSTAVQVPNLTPLGYSTAVFPHPVPVSGAYHVVLSKLTSPTGTYVIPATAPRTSGNHVSVNYQGSFMPITSFFTINISMDVVPVFKYTSLELTSPIAYKKKNIDHTPEPITVSTNATGLWTAKASDSWIQLSATSGTMSELPLTFTCLDNVGYLRNGYIAISAGGHTKYVMVQQAGGAPFELTATVDNTDQSVDLAWEHGPEAFEGVFDDAEDHTDFALNSAGTAGWTYVDGDDSGTYGFGGGATFPNNGSKMSFIVFNPLQRTPALTAEAAAPHSGYKYFASFAAGNGPNDDWMISPELSFTKPFSFSFWARTYTDIYGLERFRVLYSTTGNAVGDFTQVVTAGSYVEAPMEWTRYEYIIPEDAKYVAINCVSDDAFMFMLDDISIGTGMAPASTPVNIPEVSVYSELMPNPEMLKKAISSAPTKQLLTTPVKENKFGLELGTPNNETLGATQNGLRSSAVERKLRWDNGTNYNSIGLTAGGTMEVAILFETRDLYKYHGTKIKSVEIFPTAASSNMQLNIRKGDQIIYTQAVSGLTIGQFNRIELTTPVVIDATENMMVGYSYTQAVGNHVAGCDVGPAMLNKGDLISMNGSAFAPLSSISPYSFNWNIAVVLEDNTRTNADVTFNVYRDGSVIKSGHTTKTYHDSQVSIGDACYTVTAVYNADSELETTHSNEACIIVPSIITVQAINASRDQYQHNPSFDALITGDLMGLHTLNEVKSWISYFCPAGFYSPAGSYTIRPFISNNPDPHYLFQFVNATLTVRGVSMTNIVEHPVGANICEGSNYTFKVKAEGENLAYQWYKGNNPISGAVRSELTITNATFNDYDNYYVTVKGVDNQTVTSNTVRLWVASKLPAQLALSQYPDPAISGRTYLVRLDGAPDVTKYSWSYSKPGVTFQKAVTTENEVNVTFAQEAVGKGILTVNLEHVCGNRAVTQEIQVNYPVGIDDAGGKVRIYPNPVADVLNVKSDKSEMTNLEITDVNGRLVYQAQPKAIECSLNVSHWPKGVYLVKITTETGASVHKVIKK